MLLDAQPGQLSVLESFYRSRDTSYAVRTGLQTSPRLVIYIDLGLFPCPTALGSVSSWSWRMTAACSSR
jgi:hypothetical protein